ncbi:hypothetical protein ACHAXT_005933 [Thalassiosira profunda]
MRIHPDALRVNLHWSARNQSDIPLPRPAQAGEAPGTISGKSPHRYIITNFNKHSDCFAIPAPKNATAQDDPTGGYVPRLPFPGLGGSSYDNQKARKGFVAAVASNSATQIKFATDWVGERRPDDLQDLQGNFVELDMAQEPDPTGGHGVQVEIDGKLVTLYWTNMQGEECNRRKVRPGEEISFVLQMRKIIFEDWVLNGCPVYEADEPDEPAQDPEPQPSDDDAEDVPMEEPKEKSKMDVLLESMNTLAVTHTSTMTEMAEQGKKIVANSNNIVDLQRGQNQLRQGLQDTNRVADDDRRRNDDRFEGFEYQADVDRQETAILREDHDELQGVVEHQQGQISNVEDEVADVKRQLAYINNNFRARFDTDNDHELGADDGLLPAGRAASMSPKPGSFSPKRAGTASKRARETDYSFAASPTPAAGAEAPAAEAANNASSAKRARTTARPPSSVPSARVQPPSVPGLRTPTTPPPPPRGRMRSRGPRTWGGAGPMRHSDRMRMQLYGTPPPRPLFGGNASGRMQSSSHQPCRFPPPPRPASAKSPLFGAAGFRAAPRADEKVEVEDVPSGEEF